MKYLFVLLVLLIGATLVLTAGCTSPQKSKDLQAQELLADSSTGTLIMQKIATDHQMASQMMPMLMDHMDSTMANGACMNMMGKAHSDMKMAQHMCDMMASDTMMAGMMRSKLSSPNVTDHAAHHPEASTPKP